MSLLEFAPRNDNDVDAFTLIATGKFIRVGIKEYQGWRIKILTKDEAIKLKNWLESTIKEME